MNVEYAVEAAEGSMAPVESAVEEAGANVLEEGEMPAPNTSQSSPAAPANDAAAELSAPTTEPSEDQGEISCLRQLVNQLLQQSTQQQQQNVQQINQLVVQRAADKQQQAADIQLLKQQQATEIQQLRHEVAQDPRRCGQAEQPPGPGCQPGEG